MQPADYEPGAPPVLVLRYKTWVKSFGADPGIVNKTFVLNGVSRTLVGIMPPRFGWGDVDLWIPKKPERAAPTKAVAGAFPQFWFLLGHLKPGVSMKEAEADLTVVANRLAKVYPKDYPKHFTVHMESLTNLVVGQFKTTLFIVLAAVGLLLLIGCGNVANLLLARAITREKEFAIRSALGANRWRLIRQLLVESLLLATGGAAVGTLLAWGGLKSLIALMPQNIIPAEAVIRLNMPVLLFTLGVAALTALVFGLVPALKAARKDLNDPLRDSGKGISGGFRHGRLRDAVVVLEVGLSLTLLVAAGLLMRSFVALRDEAWLAAGSRPGGKASFAGGTIQDRGPGRWLLLPATATAEGAAGCGGSNRNQHAAAVRWNWERDRDSRQDARGEMERHVSAGQRGIFPCAENPVHRWPGFHGSRSEWIAQAGNREPDVREKVFGERESHRQASENRPACGV